tara:strand:+ start:290 stop:451 length:162 start_codon:yes stop_codon:yes gene_type:complete
MPLLDLKTMAVLLMLAKRQTIGKINLGILEKNKFAMIFTGIAFVLLNTLIVVW